MIYSIYEARNTLGGGGQVSHCDKLAVSSIRYTGYYTTVVAGLSQWLMY